MSIDLLNPPAPTLRECELTRRRAHLLGEIELAPATQPVRTRHSIGWWALFRRNLLLASMGRKVALTVVVVALIAVVAAVLPERLGRNQMTLVDQAIAAIGSRPMIHVVLDKGLNTQLVDLRSSKTTLLRSRIEVWADPKLGTLWVSTLDRKPTQTLFSPQSQIAPAFQWWRPYVSGYRAQLRSGAFHLVGSGKIAGQPVDWIASKPTTISSHIGGPLHDVVTEIAISRTTYKPLYWRRRVDGVIDPRSGVRLITAETLPRRPALFAHRTATNGPSLTSFPGGGTGIPTTLPDARTAMNPDPVVPAARIAGLRRAWVGLPEYLAPPANSYRDQIGGVTLYYGHLDYTGHPTYQGSYISITEFPHRNAVVTFNGLSLFRENAAIITNHTTATLKRRGLYVIIQASSRAQTLAAARALAGTLGIRRPPLAQALGARPGEK